MNNRYRNYLPEGYYNHAGYNRIVEKAEYIISEDKLYEIQDQLGSLLWKHGSRDYLFHSAEYPDQDLVGIWVIDPDDEDGSSHEMKYSISPRSVVFNEVELEKALKEIEESFGESFKSGYLF